MKRYLRLSVFGMIFGVVTASIIASTFYLDTLPDPFSAHDHWYDLLLLPPAFFSFPGFCVTWRIYNPPDGCYGDEWDYAVPFVLFNGLFWLLAFPIFASWVDIGKDLWRRLKAASRHGKSPA
jgi:hypothetical protein